MSHFVGLVITEMQPSEKDLQTLLLPWHEYECTGIEAYIEFKDRTEDVTKDWKEDVKKGSPLTLKAYAEQQGYEVRDDGKIGHMTNPNAKWDWWAIGGRWNGWLEKNQFQLGELPLEQLHREAETRAAKDYDEKHAIIAGRPVDSWETVVARHKEKNGGKESTKMVDAARKEYWEQPVMTDLHAKKISIWDGIEQYLVSKEEFLRRARLSAVLPYVIVHNGEWYERGQMGWWGMSSGDKSVEEWSTKVSALLNDLSSETWITVVDFHI